VQLTHLNSFRVLALNNSSHSWSGKSASFIGWPFTSAERTGCRGVGVGVAAAAAA